MEIINVHTNQVLANRATRAKNSLARMKGLLFTDCLPTGAGLLLEGTKSIHMFGMRYAIDVLFCDSSGLVLKCVENLAPWRMAACWHSQLTIELPAGTSKRTGTMAGHQLQIKD